MPAPGTMAHGMQRTPSSPKVKASAKAAPAYPRTITFGAAKRAATKRSVRKMR